MFHNSIRFRGFMLVALFAGACASLYAQDRFALVICNANYASVTKLGNPVNDATDMASILKSLGFKVQLLTDADLDSMENAVVRLGNQLQQSPGS